MPKDSNENANHGGVIANDKKAKIFETFPLKFTYVRMKEFLENLAP